MSSAELEAAKRVITDIEENEIKPIKLKITDLRGATDEPNSMEVVILKVHNCSRGFCQINCLRDKQQNKLTHSIHEFLLD
jgi:hypothetical protein